ncbi:Transcription factor [Niveomyces insectorum RCEF 264]|uniref:Transcription factor n=1 Tax=Niveomyces insectorum RCEF 264 TaxID=1081102 RepID=A0A167S3M3_9HYPO|nr:Transcription factor [Niveomyces insectorum RCEF 264]
MEGGNTSSPSAGAALVGVDIGVSPTSVGLHDASSNSGDDHSSDSSSTIVANRSSSRTRAGPPVEGEIVVEDAHSDSANFKGFAVDSPGRDASANIPAAAAKQRQQQQGQQLQQQQQAQSPSKPARRPSQGPGAKTGKVRAATFAGVKKSGPGRKPRACAECKKQKMKCEVLPGHDSCRNCLRRNLACALRQQQQHELQQQQQQHHQQGVVSLDKLGGHDGVRFPQTDSGRPAGSVVAFGADESTKLEAMRLEIQHMRESIDALLQRQHSLMNGQPGVAGRGGVGGRGAGIGGGHLDKISPQTATSSPSGTVLSAREDNTHMAMTRENSLEPMPAGEYDGSGGYGSGAVAVDEPMGSLYEVTRLRNLRSSRTKMVRPPRDGSDELDDFISKGVISEAEAEELYNIFHTSLNHYLWVGLEQTHPSFESVRKSSELLTATILTVTALHIQSSAATFDKCYQEFLALISSSMFSRYHSVDDVRALCIAAFWLSDVSWKLSGHAIRIATELNIHQSFARALAGDREHFLRARLWYMLYVCDHHFSIAYGRPPMIAESQQIREHELFLASPFADLLDRRICSQVDLMQILTRIYGRFSERRLPAPGDEPELGSGGVGGGDGGGGGGGATTTSTTAMLSEADLGELRTFNLEIDQWRARWHGRQEASPYIGTFPTKGIILYSYFAKLQLNSLAVRGVSLTPQPGPGTGTGTGGSPLLSTERKELANMGISAAASILTFVLEEADLRRALVGTPLYVHTMIAFAAVFLMKMAAQWNRVVMGLNVEPGYVSHLLRRMIELLKSSITSERHLLYHIAAGLEKMLAKLLQTAAAVATAPPPTTTSSLSLSSASLSSASSASSISSSSSLSAVPKVGLDDGAMVGGGGGGVQNPYAGLHGHHQMVGGGGGGDFVAADSHGTGAFVTTSVAGSAAGTGAAPGGPDSPDEVHFGPPPGDGSNVTMAAAFHDASAGWETLSGTLGGGGAGQEVYATDMPILNNNIIYEAFGSESANDVYNLLTSQFSY